jgi:hypothetical protein
LSGETLASTLTRGPSDSFELQLWLRLQPINSRGKDCVIAGLESTSMTDGESRLSCLSRATRSATPSARKQYYQSAFLFNLFEADILLP